MASTTSTSDFDGDASENSKSDGDLMTREKIQKLLVNAFNKFDRDERGELEFSEFKEAILSMEMDDVSETEIRELFEKLDIMGSGKVNRAQFSQAVIWFSFFLFSTL